MAILLISMQGEELIREDIFIIIKRTRHGIISMIRLK